MNKLIILLSIILIGCASTPDAIVPPKEQIINIDPRALEPCKPLQLLSAPDFETILKVTLDNFEIYAECANKQLNSIKIIKKLGNIKE